MKISKNQIRQIIREELQTVLAEDAFDDMDTALEKTKVPPTRPEFEFDHMDTVINQPVVPLTRPELPATLKATDVITFQGQKVQVKDLSDADLRTVIDMESMAETPVKRTPLRRK